MKESEFRFLGYRVSKVNIDLKDDYKPNEELENSISIENRFTPEDNRFVEVVFNLDVASLKKTFSLSLQIKGGKAMKICQMNYLKPYINKMLLQSYILLQEQ